MKVIIDRQIRPCDCAYYSDGKCTDTAGSCNKKQSLKKVNELAEKVERMVKFGASSIIEIEIK